MVLSAPTNSWPGFKSEVYHLAVVNVEINLYLKLECEKDENKPKKRPQLAHIFKSNKFTS